MSASLEKARELFLHAVGKLPPGKWDDYVAETCGCDGDLAQRVRQYLQIHRDAGSFLESPAPGLIATIDQPGTEGPGMVIGPYKLLEQIGEGGFGVVFMAEQTQPVRRKVALKVLKPGMDTRRVVARFEAERQALAIMDHPNIAKVLDGGQTASGRPYFVMELVKGTPITEFCDQNHLAPRQRLELFGSVCQAVHHAHQKGIIHRDLKPSNVMVALYDGKPVPKVIDFGVAKATGPQLTERTLVTGFGAVVGTLEYMSPEQAELNQLDVDTRSDIYSLGVLLYELLTGTTPLDRSRLKEASFVEMLRVIREEEPPRPSTRLSESKGSLASVSAQRQMEPAKLTKLVRGELDQIVLKALEKDRNHRYESAAGLARDIQRYLNNEPVQACPPSAWYRCQKLVRRHRSASLIAAAMAAAVIIMVASVAASIGWATRDRAAHRMALIATINADLDSAAAFLNLSRWNDAQTALDRAETLLDVTDSGAGSARLHDLQADLALALQLEEVYARPTAQDFSDRRASDLEYVRLFRKAGLNFAELTADDAAVRIRAKSIRLHLAHMLDIWSGVRRKAKTSAPPDWRNLLKVAQLADPDPQRDALRDALAHEDRKTLEAWARDAPVREWSPGSLHLLGIALRDLGSYDHAVALLRTARLQHPKDLWLNDELGWMSLKVLKNYDEALRYYTAAQTIRPSSPHIAFRLSEALTQKGAFSEALAQANKAIEIQPHEPVFYQQRAIVYTNLKMNDLARKDLGKVRELKVHQAPKSQFTVRLRPS